MRISLKLGGCDGSHKEPRKLHELIQEERRKTGKIRFCNIRLYLQCITLFFLSSLFPVLLHKRFLSLRNTDPHFFFLLLGGPSGAEVT